MTTPDDRDVSADRGIDVFLDAASEQAEHDFGPRPSFAAVLARAHRLDPSVVPPPQPAPPRRIGEDPALEWMLSPFVEAARAQAEFDVASVMQSPRPGLPRPRSGPARTVAVVAVLAVAAAIVLAFGLLRARNATRLADRSDSQAASAVESKAAQAATLVEEQQKPRRRTGRRSARRGVGSTASESESGEELLVIEDDESSDNDAEPSTASRRSSRSETLRKLDEQAAARLAAGDRTRAEALYRQLVRQGGRTSLAELAYGDLFTLVHRRGDKEALIRLRKEYLGKFPRGRFADDARAGLCRSATRSSQTACWERYLDDFPGGAYHRQAARALSSD